LRRSSLPPSVEVVFEAIEVRRPEPAVGREPVVELCERLRPDAIQAALCFRARLDESSVLEDAQVLGHRRLADAEPVDELADRTLPVAEQIEDLKPPRLAQDLECSKLGHREEYYGVVICLSRNAS
jgi:hypothetical protein